MVSSGYVVEIYFDSAGKQDFDGVIYPLFGTETWYIAATSAKYVW